MALPELLTRLLDESTYAVLATTNPSGHPQTSVIWATYDGDDVIFSTILGRRKTLNMERDPRVSLCVYNPADPNEYVEVRGTVTMTQDGGNDLIERLSWHYDGQSFVEKRAGNVRVVCRLAPTRVVLG